MFVWFGICFETSKSRDKMVLVPYAMNPNLRSKQVEGQSV
jgi:hypothetical protein